MAIIQVTPESLRSEATSLRSLKSEHEAEMKKLRTLILNLNEQWKGEAQDAFVSKYMELQPQFTKFIELLEGHARLMDTSAQELENTDRALKNTMSSFSV